MFPNNPRARKVVIACATVFVGSDNIEPPASRPRRRHPKLASRFLAETVAHAAAKNAKLANVGAVQDPPAGLLDANNQSPRSDSPLPDVNVPNQMRSMENRLRLNLCAAIVQE